MAGISKLIRFDQSKLQDIYQSGSVDYTIGDFNLFSVDVNTTDPNKALVSIPLQMETYSEEDARKIYDFKFKTFADTITEIDSEETLTDDEQNTEALEEEIEELRNQNELSESERKSLIITLRIQLGQGESPEDFKSEFPYDPINVVSPEDISEPFVPEES